MKVQTLAHTLPRKRYSVLCSGDTYFPFIAGHTAATFLGGSDRESTTPNVPRVGQIAVIGGGAFLIMVHILNAPGVPVLLSHRPTSILETCMDNSIPRQYWSVATSGMHTTRW